MPTIITFVVQPYSVTTDQESLQGAIIGDPQDIHCSAEFRFNGVEPNSIIFKWLGPEGTYITNDSGVTVIVYTNTFTSTLHFSYLMEGDEGNYTCNVIVLRSTESSIIELGKLNGEICISYYSTCILPIYMCVFQFQLQE